MIVNDALLNLWDVLPLLSPEQQIEFKNQAETHRYILRNNLATDSRSITIADPEVSFW